MTAPTMPPAVSPEEAPTAAAELDIRLKPYEGNSPLEAPTAAAELDIWREPYNNSSLD
jgi:hypothetical protein